MIKIGAAESSKMSNQYCYVDVHFRIAHRQQGNRSKYPLRLSTSAGEFIPDDVAPRGDRPFI